ncbi:carboxypeptidase-like regulatory domain-containing protein [Aureliella helgolandensis]|uniref:Carboxypeptidase regulatory-like domain-containing protein n=1 Tax=Aureliella helgolandensis TaxID=2527968 RepID=A0A518G3M1_9BACT|nr:carboxypeptidase-like regulatory domain-containing protein [Aureliella helgolandensis]QDV23188.1 hypothetical protein Q31a_14860 [Aureliella helgolandensis]
MSARIGWWPASVGLLLIGFSSGCGGNALGTVEAGGQVTYKGEPLAGATVTFVPQAGQRAASGVSDASGRFHATTLAAGDGAMPGRYKVTVTKTQESTVPKTTAEMSADDMRKIEREMMNQAPPPGREPVNLLPAKYKSAETSPFNCDLPDSGKGDFKFDLE